MNGPRPTARGATIARALLIGLTLAACAAAGFLLYRASAPRATLYPAADLPRTSTDMSPGQELAPVAVRKVPAQLPDLALPDREGATRRLSDWKGRPLLINFWATWCEPCRREIPLLRSLRHERSGDALEVIGIAIDAGDAVRKYAADHGIDYPVLVGEQAGLEAVSSFGMDTVLPFSVFADRDGRVVALKVGELHRDEADFILDRVRELDAGRLSLPDAREAIRSAIRRLADARRGSP